MSLRFVLYMLSLWFLVRVVTGYLLPLFRSGGRLSDDRSQAPAEADGSPARGSSTGVRKGEGGDYLDFEEVR
jgi:hypothetical protein